MSDRTALIDCPECAGRGFIDGSGDWCKRCGGHGEITEQPATIYFPEGWRRTVFVRGIAIWAWMLGGKVVRHG